MLRLLIPYLLLAFAFPLLNAGSVVPQAESQMQSELAEKADALVVSYHDLGQFSGTALIAKGDDIVFARGIGMADAETDHQVGTIFRIGSISKQFTAAMVLRLVERGVLDLQSSISTYLPDYPQHQGQQITLHMLLNHTSGIPNFTGMPIYFGAMDQPEPPATFLDRFSGLPLEFEPGSEFRYSNSGYYVLGVILEQESGMSLGELLQAELLEPLGLTQTGYDDGSAELPERSQGYEWTAAGFVPERLVAPSKIFAAGMMYSSAPDLLRWTRLLHGGDPYTHPDTHRMMTEPGPGKTDNYVYGIGIRQFVTAGRTFSGIGHGGGLNGFQSSLAYITPGDWTIVVLSNSGTSVNSLADGLRDLALGGEPARALRRLDRALAESLETRGVEATMAWFTGTVASSLHEYTAQESLVNNLGYAYVQGGETGKAVCVFRINAEIHPESSNVYDSLGEAYLADGKTADALRNYKRAYEMDPKNLNALAVINRLEDQ